MYCLVLVQVGYAEIARRFVARDKQAAAAGLPSHVMPKSARNGAAATDSGTACLAIYVVHHRYVYVCVCSDALCEFVLTSMQHE